MGKLMNFKNSDTLEYTNQLDRLTLVLLKKYIKV
jgi:hypothetical protein